MLAARKHPGNPVSDFPSPVSSHPSLDFATLARLAALRLKPEATRGGGQRMSGRLQDMVAIVTGAGSRGEGVGNGKAASILFAREGAKVCLVDSVLGRA